MERSIEYLLEVLKKKKKIKVIPKAPKMRIDIVKDFFKKDEQIMKAVELFEMFKKLDILEKTREHEFRKGVCLRIKYLGKEVPVNLETLKEYAEILERFISYVKQFLLS